MWVRYDLEAANERITVSFSSESEGITSSLSGMRKSRETLLASRDFFLGINVDTPEYYLTKEWFYVSYDTSVYGNKEKDSMRFHISASPDRSSPYGGKYYTIAQCRVSSENELFLIDHDYLGSIVSGVTLNQQARITWFEIVHKGIYYDCQLYEP
jgi:hypothetical protein